MPKHSSSTAEDLLNNLLETISNANQNKNSAPIFDEDRVPESSNNKKTFGRQKSVHKFLGGGKSADVLLWRNKKISGGVLASSTLIWTLFEWLNYNFLSLTCFALVIAMLVQFVLSNASGLLNRAPSQLPRLVLPDELFVNIAITIGTEINRFLGFLQDIASKGNLKQFIMVVASLLMASIIGSWCNFLTVLYIGFVGAHTLPVLYEKYEDEIDSFVFSLLGQLQSQYEKLDRSVLSQISQGNLRAKKFK